MNGEARSAAVEQWAWQLLRRWGVVFRDLLEREVGAPSWYELLQVYRRLEARGEIRGGRFVRGVGGEQFALGETVTQLRAVRDDVPAESGELVVVSAVDPLNLVGILTSHGRVPSVAGNRVAYWNGSPAAALIAGEVHFLSEMGEAARARVAQQLGGVPLPPSSATGEAAEVPREIEGAVPDRAYDRTYPRKIPRPLIS